MACSTAFSKAIAQTIARFVRWLARIRSPWPRRDVHAGALVVTGIALQAAAAAAGEADVVAAKADCVATRCRFAVTVRHADEGWAHYANAWQVLTADGEVLATRTLRHPHVDEQPFTRSLGPVTIPLEIDRVRIRARDSVHEWGGAELVVPLDRRGTDERDEG